MKRVILACIFVFLCLGVFGCGKTEEAPIGADENVTLLITQRYGQKEIIKKEIAYRKNLTVLDLLYDTELKIDLAYGGSFVEGIDEIISRNIGSGFREDWFFFVNGIFSDVGALDYLLKPGDVVWWDYHSWKATGGTTTAAIGFFPEPFRQGYAGNVKTTYIMSEKGDNYAVELKNRLEELNVKNIQIVEIDENYLMNPEGPTILLGKWKDLEKLSYIKNLNDNFNKAGSYQYFYDDEIALMDCNFNTLQTYKENTGIVFANGKMGGDDSPIWIVSGIDQAGYQNAINFLLEKTQESFGYYAIAVLDEEIIPLPILE